MKKSLIILIPGLAIVILLAMFFWRNTEPKPSETLGPQEGDIVVRLTDDLRFEPDSIEIEVGQTVVWVNESEKVHTVSTHPREAAQEEHAIVPEGAEHWDSSNLGPGDSFKRTFTVPGVYKYYCHPHENMAMLGEVIVREPGEPLPPPDPPREPAREGETDQQTIGRDRAIGDG